MGHSKVDNSKFDPSLGFDLGRPRAVFAFWYLVKVVFFISPLPWPSKFKVAILRLFGAAVGSNVYIKPRVNIHFPWNLDLGDNTWVGEEVFICNFARVKIGKNCCISQRAFVCSGNHDYRTASMAYRNEPIEIQDGCWVGAMAFVGPGVVMETDSVISAGSFATSRILAATVYAGNPCLPKRPRWVVSKAK
jgi:putative colanic acid biosynthesis acetyltransferase WcaF